jgi:hypothetical protein
MKIDAGIIIGRESIGIDILRVDTGSIEAGSLLYMEYTFKEGWFHWDLCYWTAIKRVVSKINITFKGE